MSMNDGGPAFPCGGSDGYELHRGMKLRDYFAAKALAAMLGSDMILDASNDVVKATEISRSEWMSGQAYKFADAMLAERAK